MIVTGPPPGIISFGGYRFVVRELHDWCARPENGAGSLAVLPDALAGHRLAGTAADRDPCSAIACETRRKPTAGGGFP